jgi:thiamine-phosphate pyrophosphorylase
MIRCYVTDRRQGNLLSHVAAAIRDGVDYIQVREKDLEAKALYELVSRVRDAAAGTVTKVLVNDRVDVAVAAGIDGAHLPGNGLPANRVRGLVRFLGCSVHSIEEAIRAERAQADFVVFGPVFQSPGKIPLGVDALRQVVEAVHLPVLAIGGITHDNEGTVLKTGAAGIAAIRLFQRD